VNEQNEVVDKIAERIQLLGGVSVAMAHDVAETTLIPRPPKGREEVPVQIRTSSAPTKSAQSDRPLILRWRGAAFQPKPSLYVNRESAVRWVAAARP